MKTKNQKWISSVLMFAAENFLIGAGIAASVFMFNPSKTRADGFNDVIDLNPLKQTKISKELKDLPAGWSDNNPTHIRYSLLTVVQDVPITIEVYATPGARVEYIKDILFSYETAQNHHDVWIFQGGKNNALSGGSNMVDIYKNTVKGVNNHAKDLGARAFFDETTPIIPEVLIQRGFPGYTYEANIILLNNTLKELAQTDSFSLIPLYDLFKPHYTNEYDAWCRNIANSGILDGSHLSAFGTRALGEVWWNGIRDLIIQKYLREQNPPRQPITIGVYGDSITASTYLSLQDRPGTYLLNYGLNDESVPVELSFFSVD